MLDSWYKASRSDRSIIVLKAAMSWGKVPVWGHRKCVLCPEKNREVFVLRQLAPWRIIKGRGVLSRSHQALLIHLCGV